jgi:DMSO/TMAO reductase YedYZ molybdopterin-dependent catalytic subunit
MINKTLGWFFLLAILISACSSVQSGLLPTPTTDLLPPPSETLVDCHPSPIIKPTMPAVIPGFADLDQSTGLHMTGSPKDIDLAGYQLKVTGNVTHPLSLSYDQLRCLPRVTAKTTLTCRGYFDDVATWSGVPLKYILDMAGIQPGTNDVLLIGADDYQAFLPLKDALLPDNFLAYEWNGQPVPILHGFPLRAVIPTMFGNKWTKWLLEIKVE